MTYCPHGTPSDQRCSLCENGVPANYRSVGKPKPKWISFQKDIRKRGAKTDVWHVWSLKDQELGSHLGIVSWRSTWRKYAFYPSPQTLFEQDCLRDLAQFIEEETVKHRKGRRVFA
jgi:hypothetical protein